MGIPTGVFQCPLVGRPIVWVRAAVEPLIVPVFTRQPEIHEMHNILVLPGITIIITIKIR